MTIEIKTINISDNQEEGFKMIAFGDSDMEDNIKNYLILQKANNFDSQDIELGMDNYYIEFNDQSNSGYGLCEKVILDQNILNFLFPIKNSEDISNITLKLDKQKYDEIELKKYLKIILGDILEIKC